MKETLFHIKAIPAQNKSDVRIWVNDQELSPKESQSVYNHSPDGFEYGYSGSGPAQTALAICLFMFKDVLVAQGVYQNFKNRYVAEWPQSKPVDVTIDIVDFMLDNVEQFINANTRQSEVDELNQESILEQARELLNTSNVVYPPVQLTSKTQFKLGDVVKINRSFMPSQQEGCLGIIYEIYSGNGVSILTESGVDLEGFGVEAQNNFIEFVYANPGFAYDFKSCHFLIEDFRKGRFTPYFKQTGNEL